jgi:hypothetical protein
VSIPVAVHSSLYEALKAEGFEMPPQTRNVRIAMDVDGAYMIVFECFLTDKMLVTVGNALKRVGESAGAKK